MDMLPGLEKVVQLLTITKEIGGDAVATPVVNKLRADLLVTTQAKVADKPEKTSPRPAAPDMGGMDFRSGFFPTLPTGPVFGRGLFSCGTIERPS